MNLEPLPAFNDNYIWVLHDGTQALAVDPGDAAPVLHLLQARSLQLEAILVTHHHSDHTGGIRALKLHTGARVYGSGGENIADLDQPLFGGERLQMLGLQVQALAVPGHTRAHLAFWLPMAEAAGEAPLLFCGDTLFSGGCGRLFEGTAAQMHQSLAQLAALPDTTRVCCAHEYTLSNLRFAQAVEPGNVDLQAYVEHCSALRQGAQPTLPSTLAQEKLINPYLRCQHAAVRAAAQAYEPAARSELEVFAALRRWKNEFA